MPCGHNACKSCIIDAESAKQPFECFYDNCVIDGIHEAHPNTAIMKKLKIEAQVELEMQMKHKIK